MAQTFSDVIRDARRRLEAAGISAAEAVVDADVLARAALGDWSRADLLTRLRELPPPGWSVAYNDLLTRRCRREPVAYIVGHREFWGLSIAVTPDTLIPRPETEGLIEAALSIRDQAPASVADVCTGTGCVALALALERPAWRIVATDVSAAALAVAARNVYAYAAADRIALVQTDLLDACATRFDLIVSNPPYVPTLEFEAAEPEVRRYEPALALDGGQDGVALIRRLVTTAAARLIPGGWLLFEFGAGEVPAIRSIVAAEPTLTMRDIRYDLAGIPRVALVQAIPTGAAFGTPQTTAYGTHP